MSRRQNTKQIIKERLSVLAVIFSCLALVVVAQGAQQYLSARAQPPTATPVVATPTPRPEPTKPAAQVTPRQSATSAAAGGSAPPSIQPSKPANLTGKWVGEFSDVVEGSVTSYQYTVELVQQGAFISGKSTIQKEDDPNTFAKFVIRGQVLPTANTFPVQLAEDLLGVQNLNAGSAVAPRTTGLNYFSAEGQETLEGEWVDRRYAGGSITGTVRLARQ